MKISTFKDAPPSWIVLVILTLGLATLSACSSNINEFDLSLDANSGSTLTTTPGDPLKAENLYGKWDVDGELTNTANGNPGMSAIASDIKKDLLGLGWKFEKNGVLKVDVFGGYEKASYRIDGPNLYVTLPDTKTESVYMAHFQFGYLYLKGKEGKWTVFEKNKFFGF